MAKIAIYTKEIEDRFEMYGDTFELIAKNDEMGTRIYERKNIEYGFHNGYEIIKIQHVKNPDGEIVRAYPISSKWGFGRAVTTRSLDKAYKYLNNGIQMING